MINRIYGIIGLEAMHSNFNANFDGEPKNVNGGQLIASDVALKHTLKVAMNADGERVLGLKRVDDMGHVLTLEDTYTNIFKAKVDKKTKEEDILKNLLTCKDVRLFGSTFAVGSGVSITSAIQISQGVNVLKDTEVYEESIISPYASAKGKTMTTIGNEFRVDKAQYLYNVDINPKQYDRYKDLGLEFKREDYDTFKEYSLDSVTRINSRTKMGCENHFVMFIEMNEGKTFTPNLRKYINIIEDDKVEYDLSRLKDIILDLANDIKGIEIFYNPDIIEVSNIPVNSCVYNIATRVVI